MHFIKDMEDFERKDTLT